MKIGKCNKLAVLIFTPAGKSNQALVRESRQDIGKHSSVPEQVEH
jgi:hypothetical protein